MKTSTKNSLIWLMSIIAFKALIGPVIIAWIANGFSIPILILLLAFLTVSAVSIIQTYVLNKEEKNEGTPFLEPQLFVRIPNVTGCYDDGKG